MRIFSGLFKGKVIQAPKGSSTRPTSGRLREALFNICQGRLEGESFLDLFAGSGAMGLEALSRGAEKVTFVDNSKESIRCIQANVQLLGVQKYAEIIYGDVFEVALKLAQKGRSYGIIYADPPYETSYRDSFLGHQLAKTIDALLEKGLPILSQEGFLFIEESSKAVEKDFLKKLTLKNSRQMGRSALHHYLVSEI